jgi:hypothetical protein
LLLALVKVIVPLVKKSVGLVLLVAMPPVFNV